MKETSMERRETRLYTENDDEWSILMPYSVETFAFFLTSLMGLFLQGILQCGLLQYKVYEISAS